MILRAEPNPNAEQEHLAGRLRQIAESLRMDLEWPSVALTLEEAAEALAVRSAPVPADAEPVSLEWDIAVMHQEMQFRSDVPWPSMARVIAAARRSAPVGTTAEARAEIVTLCGSTKFKDAFMSENARLTMEGKLVISLGLFGHTDLPGYDWSTDASDLKRTLDRLHFQKIDLADRVHVVDVGGYYGESTTREIAYARSLGKPVTFMSEEAALEAVSVPHPEPRKPVVADRAKTEPSGNPGEFDKPPHERVCKCGATGSSDCLPGHAWCVWGEHHGCDLDPTSGEERVSARYRFELPAATALRHAALADSLNAELRAPVPAVLTEAREALDSYDDAGGGNGDRLLTRLAEALRALINPEEPQQTEQES